MLRNASPPPILILKPAEWAAYLDASAIEPPAAHYRRPPPRRCCTSRRCCYACVALLGALAAAIVASIFLITRSPWVKVAQDGVEFAPDGASVSRLRVRLHIIVRCDGVPIRI